MPRRTGARAGSPVMTSASSTGISMPPKGPGRSTSRCWKAGLSSRGGGGIGELRRRIQSGEYPPGSLLPSEHQLSDEFAIARPTVVRALRVLRADGWIETQQGKGSFVRGRPALAELGSQRTGEDALNRDEAREPGDLIEAAMTAPPARVAALLGRAGDGDVLARRLVVRQDGEA